MQTEYIRTADGTILGSIEHDSNGDKTARDFPSMKILGYYRSYINRTVDFYGGNFSQGDTVVALIYLEKVKQGVRYR